jgi:ABC-type sugar transport system ATPase subunit
MDEPLINLDPDLKEKILTLIEDTTRQTQAFLVYVTHDAEEARKISGHILVLRSGQLDTKNIDKKNCTAMIEVKK